MSLKEGIRVKAHHLGFTLVGFAAPDQPPSYSIFERWVEQGYHGEMAYLSNERSRQRRRDPRSILPECRTVLVLGMPYTASLPELQGDEHLGRGKIAAYAWGDDYHDIIPVLQHQLLDFIQEQVGLPFASRCYTDTGPILERDLALRAGLGWIGKNSCLINPRQGSYFLLAEILLEIDLEPDQPLEFDYCGSCTRCLDACPTTCILPDRTLDARRCISYLTIELKGQIPFELRPQLAGWVFGCDICQQVCPWNLRFAPQVEHPALQARRDVSSVDCEDELGLTPQGFSHKFKNSPIRRSKRRGYLRNVAVALGNSHSDRVVPILAQSLIADPEPLVRQHAAWALGQIPGRQSARSLEQALESEMDPVVKAEIGSALAPGIGAGHR